MGSSRTPKKAAARSRGASAGRSARSKRPSPTSQTFGSAALRLAEGEVSALAFSRDGRLLAAGTDRGGVALFSTATGSLDRDLVAPPGESYAKAQACAFSPDGSLVAVSRVAPLARRRDDPKVVLRMGGKDVEVAVRNVAHVTLYVYDVSSGELLFARDDWTRPSLAFSPDGRLLATGAAGGHPILVLDARTGNTLREIDARFEHSVCFSPDGASLAACSSHGDGVACFHVESGQERARFGLDRASTSLVFVDDDTLLAFTPVAVQRLRIGARAEPLGPLAAGRELVVTSIGDGGKVVAGRTETSLVVVRPGADAPLVERPRAFVAALSFDGSLFAYAEGLAARLLHTATGEDAVATSGHSGHVMGMRFDDDAVTTWSVREAIVWDPATGRERADARPVLTPAPLALEAQLRHEGRIPRDTLENRSEVLLGRGPLVLLRATDSARGAELWNAATAERLVTYEPGAFAYHAVLSPSGDRLAMSFFRQGLVQLFELGSSTPITSWTLSSRGGAPRLAWAPDGAYLAAAPESAGVSVLEARKAGREVEHGDRGCAKSGLAWSPDGTLIAGTSGKRLTLWDRNGAVLAVVPMRWRALAFSPDGKRLGVADEARPRMLEVAELLGVGGAAQAKRKRS